MAGVNAMRDAIGALKQLSWRKDALISARARCALRILHGVRPEWAGEALRVDLMAAGITLDSNSMVD